MFNLKLRVVSSIEVVHCTLHDRRIERASRQNGAETTDSEPGTVFVHISPPLSEPENLSPHDRINIISWILCHICHLTQVSIHVHTLSWACACFQLSMCTLSNVHAFSWVSAHFFSFEHVHTFSWACAHLQLSMCKLWACACFQLSIYTLLGEHGHASSASAHLEYTL